MGLSFFLIVSDADGVFFIVQTGTTLMIALPLGTVLCFLDLLGARAFARGEVSFCFLSSVST